MKVNAFSDEFVGAIKIGEKGFLFMIDGNGRVIAHPDKDKILKVNLKDS